MPPKHVSDLTPGESAPPAEVQASSPEEFKAVFARLASSVAVITFRVGEHLHGFTATSLTPVSMVPPMALFCVGRENASHRYLAIGTDVGISILGEDQTDMSARFAGKTELGGYADIAVVEAAPGVSLIEGAIAGLSATVDQMIPGGDHTIYLCRLASGALGADGGPLLYFWRDYHALGGTLRDRANGTGADPQS